MYLEVGQVVEIVSNVQVEHEHLTGKITEVLDEAREVVRIMTDGEYHVGHVIREPNLEAWQEIERLASGMDPNAKRALFQAVIKYTDIEVRNVMHEDAMLRSDAEV